MNDRCDACGYNIHSWPVSDRLELYRCDWCAAVYCEECVRELAAEVELTGCDPDCAAELMQRHPDTGERLCPACWQEEKGD